MPPPWPTGKHLSTHFVQFSSVISEDPLHGGAGCAGANKKASPPGRHQEQASKQRCTFSPTTFSSVQFSSGLRS